MSQEEIDSVDVGRRLRIARETAGMTQSDAAATVNVARTTLESSGNRLNQRRLCRILGRESRARAVEGGREWPEPILKICGIA